MMKAHGVPACHDVKGDDAAQRVWHYGHLPVFLKVWISRAEEWVKTIELQSQTPGDLRTHNNNIHIQISEVFPSVAIFNSVNMIRIYLVLFDVS